MANRGADSEADSQEGAGPAPEAAGETAESGGAVAIPEDIAALSFEDAMAELEGIVRTLESGDSSLDTAIAQYERGAKLKAHCEAKLKQARARVERITVGADGEARAEDADLG